MLTALPSVFPNITGTPQRYGIRIDVLDDRIFHQHLEVAIVLIQAANSDFNVFDQFVVIVGLRHHVYFREVQRNLIGPVVLHRPDQFPAAERVVPCELNFADFDLRAFIYLEDQDHCVARGDAFVFRRHGRKLPPVLAQQFLQDHFRFLDSRGIELAFNR